MDTIELWDGSTKALIDPIGAWLTNLSDEYGDILYPKRKLKNANGESKLRGGCHVCLPNFGPGGDSGQSQHGFGRDATWSISEQQASKAVLTLAAGTGEYEMLRSQLTYHLIGTSIEITLEVANNGSTPLRIGPGFHPYFALDRGENQVLLNAQTYDTQDLSGTEFFEEQANMILHAHRRTITIRSTALSTWALWTDQLGEYVCVEPTVGGYTFLHEPTPEELLEPSETMSYHMTVSW